MTRIQHTVLTAIRKLTADGFSPSVREIAKFAGLTGIGTVHKALNELRAAGVIDWTLGVHRSIEIISEGPSAALIARWPTSELNRVMFDIQAEMGSRLTRRGIAA